VRDVTLAGEGKIQEWDAMDGKITEVDGSLSHTGYVKFKLDLKPYETKFILVGKVPVEM
jgi:hypothetical protein